MMVDLTGFCDQTYAWRILLAHNFNLEKAIDNFSDKYDFDVQRPQLEQIEFTLRECPLDKEKYEPDEMMNIGCDHFVCFECFKETLNKKVKYFNPKEHQVEILTEMHCPVGGKECGQLVTYQHFKRFLSEANLAKYETVLLKQFIKHNKHIIKCINPECSKYLERLDKLGQQE
jgi:hypothetical protein